MKLAKWSDGIIKIKGKNLQKCYIKTTSEFYVHCPYCSRTIDIGDNDQILVCPGCNKEFFAEYCSANIL